MFSAKGLAGTASEEKPTCYVCQKGYTADDVFPLNPTEEELKVLKEKNKARKKALKRQRKEKRKTASTDAKPKDKGKDKDAKKRRGEPIKNPN